MKIIIFRDGARTYDMGGQVVMRRAAAARRVGVGMPHPLSLIFLIVCGTIAMHETAAYDGVERCQRGDGGGSYAEEKKLSGLYSRTQCIDAVRSQFPTANGFTFGSWSSYGSCGTRCECYAEFYMKSWDNKQTWESCMITPIIVDCGLTHMQTVEFPNPIKQATFTLVALDVKGEKKIPVNHHTVYRYEANIEANDKCFWFADRHWRIGDCKNIGGNGIYYRKKENQDLFDDNCPMTDWGSSDWFSVNGNTRLTGAHTPGFSPAGGDDPDALSATASLTYQIRDGRYHQKCCWKLRKGNWTCRRNRNRNRKC